MAFSTQVWRAAGRGRQGQVDDRLGATPALFQVGVALKWSSLGLEAGGERGERGVGWGCAWGVGQRRVAPLESVCTKTDKRRNKRLNQQE